VAFSHHDLASLYAHQRRFSKADSLYKKALNILQKALGPDHPDLATGLRTLAVFLNILGKYTEAEQFLRRSLAIREEVLGPNHPEVAITLNDLARIYSNTDRFTEAEALYQRTLTIKEKNFGQEHREIASLLNDWAISFYHAKGNYAGEEMLLRRSLAIWEKTFGPDDIRVAQSLNNLANVYTTQGRYAEAEPMLRRMLAIYDHGRGPATNFVATGLNSLASLYLKQGKLNEAEPILLRALAIREKALGPDHPDLAIILDNLAELFRVQNKHNDADSLLQRTLAIREKALGADHTAVAKNLNALARTMYLDGGEKQQTALPLIERAIRIWDANRVYPEWRVDAYALRGRWRKQMGDQMGALNDLSEALRSAEKLRPQVGGGEETRAGFFEKYDDHFDEMVAWQLEAGQMEEALEYAERGQARALLDQLAVAQIDLLNSIQDKNKRISLSKRQSAAKARMAEYQQRQNVLASRKDLSAEEKSQQSAALKDSLELATKEYEQVWEEIKLASPLWQNMMTSGGQPVALTAVQQSLIPEKSLMLLYQIGKEQSHLFVIPPGIQKPEVVPLQFTTEDTSILQVKVGPLTSADLKKILLGNDSVSAALGVFSYLKTSPDLLKSGQEKSATARLQALRRVLVPDTLWAKLAEYTEVILIPDGLLHQLPFEALVVQSGNTPKETRYWIDEGPVIRYAPSATILDNLEKRTIADSPTSVGKPSILSLSDPIFDMAIVEAESKRRFTNKPVVVVNDSASAQPADILEELRTASRGNEIELASTLPRLPGTALETDYVRKHFGVKNVKILQGLQADEPNLRANIQGKRYLHLATHGLVELQHSSLSNALALTLPPKDTVDSQNDGFLKLYEIYELQLPDCELAVLSACDTQYGRLFEGEGVFALSRGFLAAGVRRVVASHWQVADFSSAELIGAFFRVVATAEKEGKPVDYARALHDAKRKLRQWAVPYFWAPFIIIGKK